MSDSILVNQVYLIFNRPQFLVDSNVFTKLIIKKIRDSFLNPVFSVYTKLCMVPPGTERGKRNGYLLFGEADAE